MARHSESDNDRTETFARPGGRYPLPPAPRRPRRWPWVVGLCALVAVLVVSCGALAATTTAGTTTGTAAAPTSAAASPTSGTLSTSTPDEPVTYEVTGDGGARRALTISYMVQGGQSQENGQGLPWRATTPASGFQLVSVSAQSGSGSGSSSITCTIRQGDQVIQTNTSRGAYSVVTCSGTAN